MGERRRGGDRPLDRERPGASRGALSSSRRPRDLDRVLSRCSPYFCWEAGLPPARLSSRAAPLERVLCTEVLSGLSLRASSGPMECDLE